MNLRSQPLFAPLLPVALALSLASAACLTVVDVEPPQHAPQLVAQSFFTKQGGWAVRVTSTVPYDSPEAPEFIEDAEVEIWEGDRLIARPMRTDSGTYVEAGSGAVRGRTYTLRVSAPGYPSTEGSDALPPSPPVAAFEERLVPPADDTAQQRRTRIQIRLEDPPGTANYYGLLVLQAHWREDRRTGQRRVLPPSIFPFESDDPALKQHALATFYPDIVPYHEAFFTDDLFDGTTYTLHFDVRYEEPGTVIQRAFAVALLSVSEDFFYFWKTAGQQALINNNPFAEPLRIHANMTSGFGIFASYQDRLFPLGTDSLALDVFAPDILCGSTGLHLSICGGTDPLASAYPAL